MDALTVVWTQSRVIVADDIVVEKLSVYSGSGNILKSGKKKISMPVYIATNSVHPTHALPHINIHSLHNIYLSMSSFSHRQLLYWSDVSAECHQQL